MGTDQSVLTNVERRLLIEHMIGESAWKRKYGCMSHMRKMVHFGKWDEHPFAKELLKKR